MLDVLCNQWPIHATRCLMKPSSRDVCRYLLLLLFVLHYLSIFFFGFLYEEFFFRVYLSKI